MTNKFRITQHVRERYLQRMRPKYRRLIDDPENPDCKELSADLLWEIHNNRSAIDEEIRKKLDEAIEDRSWVNNTQFTTRIYEKYGYDCRIRFLVNGPATFIVVNDSVVVTVVHSTQHIAGTSANRKKFKKAIA